MVRINMQVVNPTTAAQYFHVLRRQLRRPFRKPLIVIAPKKLLRFKDAGSPIEDFKESLRFKRVIGDQNKYIVADEKVKRVIFCSGQVYYELETARVKSHRNDIAICRVEQIAPFPFRYIEKEVQKYKNADVMWVQEEPKNQGCWNFV
jgi:2-oxoglutarate dehydrogenase E1 component